MRWLARRWRSIENAVSGADVVIPVVRVVRFWSGLNGHAAGDVVEGQQKVVAPVEPCAPAYAVEVRRASVEADCSNKSCVVKVGPEVITHGANGAGRDDRFANGTEPLRSPASDLEGVHEVGSNRAIDPPFPPARLPVVCGDVLESEVPGFFAEAKIEG